MATTSKYCKIFPVRKPEWALSETAAIAKGGGTFKQRQLEPGQPSVPHQPRRPWVVVNPPLRMLQQSWPLARERGGKPLVVMDGG